MGAQHTPGPWAVHPQRAYVVPAEHVVRPIGGADDPQRDLEGYAQEICAMHWPDRHRSEAEVRANAVLTAAAPDLVAALKAAEPHLQRIAAQQPTTEGRFKRKREAEKALALVSAAIAKAEGRAS